MAQMLGPIARADGPRDQPVGGEPHHDVGAAHERPQPGRVEVALVRDEQGGQVHIHGDIFHVIFLGIGKLKNAVPVLHPEQPKAKGIAPEQAQADLKRLGELIIKRKPEDMDELETMHYRYLAAPPPGAGEKATTAYRLRLLFLDRWNLWPRLTKYRTWQGPGGETVDGTNNGSERAIGWWIKERYRTMRGYKRPKSVKNVVTLTARMGARSGRYDMTELYM